MPTTLTGLYEDQYDAMVRVASLLLGSADAAHDVVQDAFIRVGARLTVVREPVPYLRRAVVNGCHSQHRRLARERGRLPSPPVMSADPTDVDGLFDVLAALPERQRAAIVLRFYADLSEREVAKILGCQRGTVGSLVHRGLTALREVLET